MENRFFSGTRMGRTEIDRNSPRLDRKQQGFTSQFYELNQGNDLFNCFPLRQWGEPWVIHTSTDDILQQRGYPRISHVMMVSGVSKIGCFSTSHRNANHDHDPLASGKRVHSY